MEIQEKLIKRYSKNFKRKSNFIEKLKAKRVARKAQAGLWIKMSKFEKDRAFYLLHKRVELRLKGIKLFKFSYKNKEYPKSNISKIIYFYNLYIKKRNLK